MQKDKIQLFEDKKIRTAWEEEIHEWYFSVNDVVEALTDSKDVEKYIKEMLSRDDKLHSIWNTICMTTELTAADGKKYETNIVDLDGIDKIIQAIPSDKTEGFKMWLAKFYKERSEARYKALDIVLTQGQNAFI